MAVNVGALSTREGWRAHTGQLNVYITCQKLFFAEHMPYCSDYCSIGTFYCNDYCNIGTFLKQLKAMD